MNLRGELNKPQPTKRSWFWKLSRFLVSIFILRRAGQVPIYDEEGPQEGLDSFVNLPKTEAPVYYRASNKFDIRLLLEFWKGMIHLDRSAAAEDHSFVWDFMQRNISQQIPPDELREYHAYYDSLKPGELRPRNSCVFIKNRINRELRLRLVDALFLFAHSRAFTPMQLNDLTFNCEIMGIPAEAIRQAEFAAKRETEQSKAIK